MAYKKIITLDFLHAYYANERSSKYAFQAEDSLEIVAAPETVALMQHHLIRTNKEAANNLSIYVDTVPSKKQFIKPLKDGQKLVFFVFVKNWDYLFYSDIATQQEVDKCLFFTNIKKDGTITPTFDQQDIVWNDHAIALKRERDVVLEVINNTTVLKKKGSNTVINPTAISTVPGVNKKASFNMSNATSGVYALQTNGVEDDKSTFYYCQTQNPPLAVVEIVWKNAANNLLDDNAQQYSLKFKAVESFLEYKIHLKKKVDILGKSEFPKNITIKDVNTLISFPTIAVGSENVELKSNTTLLFRETKLPILTLSYEEEETGTKKKTITKNIPLPQAKEIIKTNAGLVATLFIHQ